MAVSNLVATSGFNPTNLTLRHTITSTGAVSIPAGITQVFAVVIGGGGGGGPGGTSGGGGGGGGGGGVSYGWVVPSNYAIIGSGGVSNGSGSPSSYANLIAGGGARGIPGSISTPENAVETHMGNLPFYIGNGNTSQAGAVFANNGSCGGAGSGSSSSTQIAFSLPNRIALAPSQTNIVTYESVFGNVSAPIGAGQVGSSNSTATNGNTNGVSGSGGTNQVNSTFPSSGGIGGYGYFAAGGGCSAANGGNTAFFNGGSVTRASDIGGGGGAGAVSAGNANSGRNGGAGGTGGGGGGGGAYANPGPGAGGVGGSGAVLIYY